MSDPRPAETVAVVGLGVMGGSLVRALAALPGGPRVRAHDASPDEREAVRASGLADVVTERAEEAVADTDLVVYATPLATVGELLEAHAGLWAARTVVTDVASLKAPLVRRARALGVEGRWVGSHPLVGSESSGWGASRADLYADAPVWVTEDTGTAGARAAVVAFWRRLGARPLLCGADGHDARMVWASQLPQLVANALAAELERAGLGVADLGPGGRDATRLAGSSPRMWRDLLRESGDAAAQALDAVAARLTELSARLTEGRIDEVADFMERTRRWRGGAGDDR